jgi:hypothetical protein
MTTPDITLHQISPIIGAILDERRLYESAADEHEAAGEQSAAMLARSKAQVIDATLTRVIEVVTGKEVSHV